MSFNAAGHTLSDKPCVSHLAALTALRALTLVDSPFRMHSGQGCTDLDDENTASTSTQIPVAHAAPLAHALGYMPHLTRLRLGHATRLMHLCADEADDATNAAEVTAAHEVYAALRGLTLQDLTLDCHAAFGHADLAAVVSNRSLQVWKPAPAQVVV
jgi:hypothetical protein